MSPENKKEAPQTNPQDKNINIHKNIITENCGFVKRELVVDNFAGGGASIGIEQAIGRSVDIRVNLPEMCGGEGIAAG